MKSGVPSRNGRMSEMHCDSIRDADGSFAIERAQWPSLQRDTYHSRLPYSQVAELRM